MVSLLRNSGPTSTARRSSLRVSLRARFVTLCTRVTLALGLRSASERASRSQRISADGLVREDIGKRTERRSIVFWLLGCLLLLGAAQTAQAGTDFCSDYPLVNGFHVIDGNDPALDVLTLPSSVGIDSNCYFKNFQISAKWPNGLTSTLNFKDDGFLAIFENVYYGGNMACATTTTKIWFVNNATYAPNNSCQSLFIPVETINKASPAPTANIGVPFTYTLTIPVVYDPATGTYYDQPSVNTLIDATIYDDLTTTGASITYVSNTAFLVNGATRTPIGALTLGATPTTISNLGIPASDNTKHLVFSSDFNSALQNIPAGSQVEIQLTVILDDVPANVAGTQFVNTAKWWFGRQIDGVNYAPLPGQSGISAPMTISEPDLVVTKSSSVANLNVGNTATYTLDIQNIGGGPAWNATITDNLPAGMCTFDPTPSITARIYASDGVTPVSAPLVPVADYLLNWTGGTASACTLSLTMRNAGRKIGATERLIITYDAALDAGTPAGLNFTNVAGATKWYSADSNYTGQRVYTKTLSNGSPGTLDFQDAFTITSATAGYYFLKSVQDLTTGVLENSTSGLTAFPGDTVRYTLQIQNFNIPQLNNITVSDDLGALNGNVFVPGSLALASTNLPAGTYSICSNCGTNGAGTVSISGLTLGSNTQYYISFDITLDPALANGTVVKNQASLNGVDAGSTNWSGVSDDPYINGPSLLGATGDQTPLTVQAPTGLSKVNTQATATIGQQFTYQITVPASPVDVPLYDVRILDPLVNSAADMAFVSASVVSGGSWSLVNTGTATSPVIEDLSTGIDIPAGQQAKINITVQLQNTATNVDGLTFTNTASYTYNKVNGDNTTQGTGAADTTANMTVIEPSLTASKTVSYVSPSGKLATAAAAVGDVLEYTITIPNNGTATAYDTDVIDFLPSNLALVANSATATIGGVAVGSFVATPITLANGALAWGNLNSDGSLDIPVGQSLVLTYRATVMTVNGTPISNSAYVAWTSLNGSSSGERTGDGCPTITAPNSYCYGPVTSTVTSLDPTALAKSVVSDTWITAPSNATDGTLRIGDTVVFNLALTLREGDTDNVVVTDQLPAGLVYDSTISISPASGSNFTYAVAAQPSPGATGNISWDLGTVSNAVDNDLSNNTLTIQFRARVLNNTLAQTPLAQLLTNNVTLNYSIGGTAATPKAASAAINVWQPQLSVSKSATTVGGGTVLGANEVVTYTVDIENTGTAPAYDSVLQDTLPIGMRTAGVTTVSMTLVSGATTTALPTFAPTYNAATGVAVWDFDSGIANQYVIPPGDILRVEYSVTTDATLSAGVTLTNQALVQHYYSFDSVDVPPNSVLANRQDYGPTGTATTTLTTAAALALSKQALATTAAIGQPFVYRITIPATPQPTALNDVRVLDDISLATTGVSLSYVSANARLVSNTKTWATLTNSGTATNLVLVDTASGGLDIPANDQLVVDVTLVLTDDTINNTVGKSFTNTANYQYNSINDDNSSVTNGAPGASGPITIVGPNLIMDKSGPATMRLGAAGTFTLNVQNTGGATAWNTVITDVLPYVTTPPAGGMCSAAPTIVSAGIYDSTGATLLTSLTNGTDFNVSFTGTPSCTYTLTMLTAAASIPSNDRLIINYSTNLDPGTASNLALTNIAGATQYLSADPSVSGAAGNVHTYNNTLTDGTPTVTDFQDAYTVTTEAPVLTFTKDVYDVTTSSSGTSAHPGDTLRYTITITNTSPVDATNFTLTDDLDNLNSAAMFVPNTMAITSALPSGAVDSSSSTGGSKGTGYVQISNLNVGAQGSANDSITIVYTVQLVPVIDSGTVVLNQAQIDSPTLMMQLSDDPNTAIADDPTHTTISSAPRFQIYKTSADLTGSPTILLAGDTLRYTITVKNIGDENAINATLKDQVPANTTYVTGSMTLNGNPVDPTASVLPLQNGMMIYSPADTTAGHMPADSSSTTTNVATITFDVTINAGVVSGTVISNQGFLTASGNGSGPINEQPSDDPNTTIVNDPTLNVIGNVPLIDAVKTVTLDTDLNGNGYVDANDVLLYTITVTNYGKVQASGVILNDAVPVDTTYVPNSTTLNTLAVTDAAGGASPLVAGIPISSADLTPPLPAVGYLSPGGTATITFKVKVDNTVGAGVVISNQGFVYSNEQAVEPTDADGNDSNGDQPTVIVTGNAQQLAITKQVSVVGGGPATAGGQLEYMVQVTNVGLVPATNVVISDNLDEATPGYMSYDGSTPATLNGATLGVTFSAPILTADYSTTYGPLQPGQTATLRFRVNLDPTLAIGTTVTNIARAYWNLMTQTASASVSIDIGGTPGTANLNGRVWHDQDFDKTYDSGETRLDNWTVQLYFKGKLIATTLTDSNGDYHFTGLASNYLSADRYELRFVAPGAGPNTAKLGMASSGFTNGLQIISDIIVYPGKNLQDLNLPIDPNGVVYDSIVRVPVAGATVTMLQAAGNLPLPASCFDDPAQQNQVTLAYGYYKFNLNFSQPECPAGVDYLIQVTAPASGYVNGESLAIPPQTNAATAAFSVPNCLGGVDDAVPSTPDYCEVQTFPGAPVPAIPAGAPETDYYLKLTLANAVPGQSQLFNNPIPLDPQLDSAVAISKTSPKVNVTRGELVPYTIKVNNSLIVALSNVTIIDNFPAGFKYVPGSARVNGVPVEPVRNGLTLNWNTTIPAQDSLTLKLLLIVGAGVQEGDYVNRAHVFSNATNSNASNEASATVQVVPDPIFDCSDIIGKVFDDKNLNGYQDANEQGLGGVRLVTARGLLVTTDPHGRFHISCAAVPNEQRGSNFIIKLDERSLPSGYRVTTENPRVQRLTRGKAINFNFGATLHRVVTLDIADGVFEHDSSEMRTQWVPRLGLLIDELRKAPAVLRLTYLADVESKSVVNARIDAIKDRIMEHWQQVGGYPLTIETEVFWRHGGPVDRAGFGR